MFQAKMNEGGRMKVLIFLSKETSNMETMKQVNQLILKTFERDIGVDFEKVMIEDNPNLMKVYNITNTPMTIISDQRYPGIPTMEKVLEIKKRERPFDIMDHLKEGTVQLLGTKVLSRILDHVKVIQDKNKPFLCITRTYPQVINKKYHIMQDHIIWLVTRTIAGQSVAMTEPDTVADLTCRFMRGREKPFLLLDGVDLLVQSNGLPRVLTLVEELVKTARDTKAVVLLLHAPRSLSQPEVQRLSDTVSK